MMSRCLVELKIENNKEKYEKNNNQSIFIQ